MKTRCRVEVSTGGNAVISTESGSYTYNREEKVRSALGTHLGMWLQPAMSQIHTWDEDDEYPFKNITGKIDLLVDQANALRDFLGSLDKEFSLETRRLCAERAQKLCERPEVATAIRKIVLETPLPPEADPTHGPQEGQIGVIFREMLAKWRP